MVKLINRLGFLVEDTKQLVVSNFDEIQGRSSNCLCVTAIDSKFTVGGFIIDIINETISSLLKS